MKKSGVKSKIIGIMIILICIGIYIGSRQIQFEKHRDIEVSSWENMYEDTNIQMYYINNSLSQIAELGNTYETKSVVKSENNLAKTMEMNSWLKEKCSVSEKNMATNKSTDEILANLIKNEALSQSDYSNVLQELLSSVSVITRIGYFRGEKNYNMLEVWDQDLNKWVAFDVLKDCYYEADGVPLSGTDLITVDLNNVQEVKTGNEKNKLKKREQKAMKSYISTYSVKIDNSKYEDSNINAYITYVKEDSDIQLETDKTYLPPTIFVEKTDLFDESPYTTMDRSKSDNVPTIILCKADSKNTESNINFNVGSFMNSMMMTKYYLRINGGEYKLISNYYQLETVKGENTLELSMDGKNTIRTITFNRN